MEATLARQPIVLVVDDCEPVRAVLNVVLQHLGFSVRLAANGREAVAVFEKERQDIALVLLDVQMPGLDGPQTLDALRSKEPEVRCAFMTGDAGGYSEAELRGRGAALVLAKPFDLARLGQALEQLLGKPRRAA